MAFNVALLCMFGFVALASCQLYGPGGRFGQGGGRFGQGGRNKGPHHDGGSRFKGPHKQPHKEPVVQHQKKGYAEVIEVNYLNGGYYDAYHAWNVDCNANGDYPHKYISGIWDDKNNFNDLDKVKCDSHGDGVTLDLDQYVEIIPLDPKNYRSEKDAGVCPTGYVLTALYDKAFGFPNVSWGKCNKVLYGELDNKNLVDMYTDGEAGGPYGLYHHWNIQCPEHYVAVGVQKHGKKIKTLVCAYLVSHH